MGQDQKNLLKMGIGMAKWGKTDLAPKGSNQINYANIAIILMQFIMSFSLVSYQFIKLSFNKKNSKNKI